MLVEQTHYFLLASVSMSCAHKCKSCAKCKYCTIFFLNQVTYIVERRQIFPFKCSYFLMVLLHQREVNIEVNPFWIGPTMLHILVISQSWLSFYRKKVPKLLSQ